MLGVRFERPVYLILLEADIHVQRRVARTAGRPLLGRWHVAHALSGVVVVDKAKVQAEPPGRADQRRAGQCQRIASGQCDGCECVGQCRHAIRAHCGHEHIRGVFGMGVGHLVIQLR